jgi:hypothetical protein
VGMRNSACWLMLSPNPAKDSSIQRCYCCLQCQDADPTCALTLTPCALQQLVGSCAMVLRAARRVLSMRRVAKAASSWCPAAHRYSMAAMELEGLAPGTF